MRARPEQAVRRVEPLRFSALDAKQPPLLDWRISLDRDASFAAPRHQIILDAAPCQVVANLVGRNVRAAGESPKLDHVQRRNC